MYKCLHGSAPAYLTEELCQVTDIEARQRLRSSSSSSLIVSRTRLPTVGDRAFPVAAARVSNSLPDLVTAAPSVVAPSACDCSVRACAVTLVAFGHYNRSCLLKAPLHLITVITSIFLSYVFSKFSVISLPRIRRAVLIRQTDCGSIQL